MRRPAPIQFNWPATSEQIRVSLGLLTPAEREAKGRREAKAAQEAARKAAQGLALFGDLEKP